VTALYLFSESVPWSFASIDNLKLLLMFAEQYLTGRVKMAVIFTTYDSLDQAFFLL